MLYYGSGLHFLYFKCNSENLAPIIIWEVLYREFVSAVFVELLELNTFSILLETSWKIVRPSAFKTFLMALWTGDGFCTKIV